MLNENTQNTTQQQSTQQGAPTQPEDNGSTEKVFTQEDVNRIVSERLARDRAGREVESQIEAASREAALSMREAEFTKKEQAFYCREFLREGGYKMELAELFPTDNVENFKQSIAKLIEICPHLDPNKKVPYFGGPLNGNSQINDSLASAFKPKY